jgi:hypothetical protein
VEGAAEVLLEEEDALALELLFELLPELSADD